MGFHAGDANLYRYVGNNPTNLTDPTGLESVDHWKKLARDKIGKIDAEPGSRRYFVDLAFRRAAAYAEIYGKNPNAFRWAGLAAFASESAARGIAIAPLAGLSIWIPKGEGAKVLPMLAEGNEAIFEDIYWQFLAYDQGGLKELTAIHEKGQLNDLAYAAWATIDEGVRNKDDKKIWQGNLMIAEYEQKIVLQAVFAKYAVITQGAGHHVSSILPVHDRKDKIGTYYSKSFMEFYKFDPEKNFGNFDERWKWISESMWPDYIYLYEHEQGSLAMWVRDIAMRSR